MGVKSLNAVAGDAGAQSTDGCTPCKVATPDDSDDAVVASRQRRAVLAAIVASGVGVSLPRATVAADPKTARPQEGDAFVFSHGDRARQVISGADLTLGGPPVLAWPVDPATNTIRDGSRLNQVLLLRLDVSQFDETTRARAADGGIVAYSASCTHALCPVNGWRGDRRIVHCPCHNSEFDPSNGAKVVFGPAPRPLPALPLKVVDGAPVAVGGFTGKVGAGTT